MLLGSIVQSNFPPPGLEHLPLCPWLELQPHSLACSPSCKEGCQDFLGRDTPDISGSTGTIVASGTRKSCGMVPMVLGSRDPLCSQAGELCLQGLTGMVELYQFRLVVGVELTLSPLAFLLHPNMDLHLHFPQIFPQGPSCLLHQTPDRRDEISGTHGYSIILE